MSNTTSATKPQTHKFETEITQLLDLMIHSLYSEKEIFLRELISNASDAIDKRRFAALTDSALLPDESEMRIQISANKENKVLTIVDTGIGMNEEEVINNIGTIARSGTKKFMQALSEKNEQDNSAMNLIGQFGVGFYSVFMVADSVQLDTKKAGEKTATRWISSGKGEYSLETIEKDQVGTTITLTLKDDEEEYLESHRLQHIIKKYSDHISLPIEVETIIPASGEGDDKKDEETVWEQANSGTALWSRSKTEIEKEEYDNFYQTLSYDQEPPVSTLHHRVEGNIEYTSLLFIPKKAPFDLYQRDSKRGLKLYVRRVFIMDDAESLVPNYLRFVKGIVDSADLPLNVSREILQSNRDIDKIKSGVTKRILNELSRLQKDETEQYADVWKEFGQVLKEGVVEDFANKDKLSTLFQFASTNNEGDSEEQSVTLTDYVSRMQESQDAIYYITAESHKAAIGSPHLEVFRKKGVEVLILSDHVDEWLVNSLPEFDGKPLKSVARGDLELDEKEKAEQEEQSKTFSDVTAKLKEILESRVKDVKITHRLTDSPACLVADESDPGANLERIMKAMGQDAPSTKPILEINPDHDIVKALNVDQENFEDWAFVMFDQAALSEGAVLNNPSDYVKRVNKLLSL